jgi:hypothetical protein
MSENLEVVVPQVCIIWVTPYSEEVRDATRIGIVHEDRLLPSNLRYEMKNAGRHTGYVFMK